MLDLNHNGIPDYQEPTLWKWLGTFVSTIVKTFAAPHTVAYRVADLYLSTVGSGNPPSEP